MQPSAEIVTAPTESLSAATRASIIELCVAAHDNDDFRNLFTYVPSGGRHFLAYRDEALIAHAMVTTRWLQPEGHHVLETAYVDAVATLPALQGEHYGSALMRHLAEEIARSHTIACLETDKPGFYSRLGWEPWRGPLAGRGERGLVPTPNQRGIMVLRLPMTPVLDLDGSLSIECQPGRIW